MNLNQIIALKNSDIIHEFLNHTDRVHATIRNKLAPMVVDTPWMAGVAADYIENNYRARLITSLDDFFVGFFGGITKSSIDRRLYGIRIETLQSLINEYHNGFIPAIVPPYAEGEWRRFYSQIWGNEAHSHGIVDIISYDQGMLALHLWEWLKANYPNYVKID